jgi:hypothetical protein
MTDLWSQPASLTGARFAVLVAASVVTNSSYTTKASASAAKVVSFYTEHYSAAAKLPALSKSERAATPL